MEKYGVEEDLDKDKTKTAQATPTECPTCGTRIRPRGVTGVLLCPKCGSKPFEHTEIPDAPK